MYDMEKSKERIVTMKISESVHAKFKKFVKDSKRSLQGSCDMALIEYMRNNRDLAKKKRVK